MKAAAADAGVHEQRRSKYFAAEVFSDEEMGAEERAPFEQQASITVQVNYHGTLAVTRAMLPLLRAIQRKRQQQRQE